MTAALSEAGPFAPRLTGTAELSGIGNAERNNEAFAGSSLSREASATVNRSTCRRARWGQISGGRCFANDGSVSLVPYGGIDPAPLCLLGT
jgi:hypothetical protein